MAQLSIEQAKATAKTALSFLAAFDGEDFGFLREDTPGPHDRRHLAIALDHVQELAAMVLNLADLVPTEQPKSDRAPDGRTYIRSHTPGCNCKECMPPNALAQADAACGVSPGAMGCASNGDTEDGA